MDTRFCLHRSIVRTTSRGASLLLGTLLFIAPSFAQPAAPDAPAVSSRVGSWELELGAQGMAFYAKRIGGFSLGAMYRWPGREPGSKDGHFSIGLRANLWPDVARWNELPYRVGAITDSRIGNSGSDEPEFRLNDVVVEPNEVFLAAVDDLFPTVSGSFNPNPISNTLFIIKTNRISDVRLTMAGAYLPIRWYFGPSGKSRPRFFLEGGPGIDVLMVRANYTITTQTFSYDPEAFRVRVDETLDESEMPFGEGMAKNVMFMNGSFGAGLDIGRFKLVFQARTHFTSTYDRAGTAHKRIRGNMLVIPALADVESDEQLSQRLSNGQIVPFGHMQLAGKEEGSASKPDESGVSALGRFWDGSQMLIMVSYQLH